MSDSLYLQNLQARCPSWYAEKMRRTLGGEIGIGPAHYSAMECETSLPSSPRVVGDVDGMEYTVDASEHCGDMQSPNLAWERLPHAPLGPMQGGVPFGPTVQTVWHVTSSKRPRGIDSVEDAPKRAAVRDENARV
jgi:hypothetical protein